jgi:hypothetical protein
VNRQAILAVGVLIAASGCGGSSTEPTPTPPPAPSGTVVSVAVASSGPTVFLGGTETFVAVATLSTGATENLNGGTWSTDAPAVATVGSGTGKVAGVSNGAATVSVEYQGLRGSKAIRVVPNYSGAWLGNFIVSGCTQSGGISDNNLCASFPVGASRQYGLQLSQAADVVSGTTSIGLLGMSPFTANIATDGTLTFSTGAFPGTTTIMANWSLTSLSAGVINGTVAQVWTDQVLTGEMDIAGTLNPPSNGSALARVAAARVGPRRSLAEALAAVGQALTSGYGSD